MGFRFSAGVMAGLLAAAGAACAQATPQHPISTAPEGPQAQKTCSFTVTDESGKPTTYTSTCPGAASQKALSPAASQANQEICARESKQERELDLRCPSADAPPPPPASTVPSAKERFPFPGETSSPPDAAVPAAEKSAPDKPGLQDAGSSGESSSAADESSSSSSSAVPSADDVDSDTPVAPKRNQHKKSASLQPEMTKDQRVTEDLNVAGFYANDGNYNGVYLRAKDAVTLADEDPEAHLALAIAARKLGKLDEARKNFERTLALDPVTKTKKEAERALKEMTGG